MNVFAFPQLMMLKKNKKWTKWTVIAKIYFRDHGNGALMGMEPSSWSTVTVSELTGRNQTLRRTLSLKFQVGHFSLLFTLDFFSHAPTLASPPNHCQQMLTFAFAKSQVKRICMSSHFDKISSWIMCVCKAGGLIKFTCYIILQTDQSTVCSV